MDYQVLVIDDEIEIAESTAEYFNMFDIKTAYVTGYEEGMTFLREHTVSLLLLDINLGSSSGFELCKEVRSRFDIPILFISARTSDDDVLTALNIGGDDYIKKPYTLNILLAKVKVFLNRYEKMQSAVTVSEQQSDKDFRINEHMLLDGNYHQLMIDQKTIRLKEQEYQILLYLAKNAGHVLTKEKIFENVWGDSFVTDGTLAVHIRHLREKIEINPNEPEHIKTVWGIGYVFEA